MVKLWLKVQTVLLKGYQLQTFSNSSMVNVFGCPGQKNGLYTIAVIAATAVVTWRSGQTPIAAVIQLQTVQRGNYLPSEIAQSSIPKRSLLRSAKGVSPIEQNSLRSQNVRSFCHLTTALFRIQLSRPLSIMILKIGSAVSAYSIIHARSDPCMKHRHLRKRRDCTPTCFPENVGQSRI